MTLTAHQPGYLPWLGLFDKIRDSDMFVFYDHVQYKPKHTDNRNKIKTQNGVQWLTVPCNRKDHFNTRICDVRIIQGNWQRKHARAIELSYQKAPNFDHVWEKIGPLFQHISWRNLADLNIALTTAMMELLGVSRTALRSSDMNISGSKAHGVLDMCKKVGATKYIFGANGKKYMGDDEIKMFKDNGVEVLFQSYDHPHYHQLHGDFVSHLSAIDFLFNADEVF